MLSRIHGATRLEFPIPIGIPRRFIHDIFLLIQKTKPFSGLDWNTKSPLDRRDSTEIEAFPGVTRPEIVHACVYGDEPALISA